jgi:hypothetical protein
VTSRDALLVINFINTNGVGEPEPADLIAFAAWAISEDDESETR